MNAESLKHEFAIDLVEKKIWIPASEWPGRCYEIAAKILKSEIVNGKLRYGHWLGPVKFGTMFYGKQLIHHGWIEQKDLIIDPTRWVFEGVASYIYVGENDYYDVGGNVFRSLSLQPPQSYENQKEVEVKASKELEEFLLNLLGHPYLTAVGLFWIANLPVKMLGSFAKETYRLLDKMKMSAFVPIDNYDLIMKG